MNEPKRPRPFRTAAVALAAAAACAAATSALGCSAATVGLGSLGLGVGALVTYLLLAAGGGTACAPRGPVGVCLSVAVPPPDAGETEDAVEPLPGPCLQPYPSTCLQYMPVQPCLEYAPVEPCLEYVPVEPYAHECLSIAPSPCLSMPAPPADAGTAEPDDVPAPSVHICLSDDLIEGELVPPGAQAAPPPPTADGAPAQRLAAAGVLTDDQLRRLARLRGER
jgi:hypothetical protein